MLLWYFIFNKSKCWYNQSFAQVYIYIYEPYLTTAKWPIGLLFLTLFYLIGESQYLQTKPKPLIIQMFSTECIVLLLSWRIIIGAHSGLVHSGKHMFPRFSIQSLLATHRVCNTSMIILTLFWTAPKLNA